MNVLFVYEHQYFNWYTACASCCSVFAKCVQYFSFDDVWCYLLMCFRYILLSFCSSLFEIISCVLLTIVSILLFISLLSFIFLCMLNVLCFWCNSSRSSHFLVYYFLAALMYFYFLQVSVV